MEQGLNDDAPTTRRAIWWIALAVVLAVAVAVGLAWDFPADPAPKPTVEATATTETSLIPPVSIDYSTSTFPESSTTTTSAPPRTTTTRVSRGVPRTPPPVTEPPAVDGETRSIGASAYCLSGRMANGRQVHDGAVASVVLPMGSTWRIVQGKLEGKVLTVEDTGGPRATFDVWMASCSQAMAFGRPRLVIQRIG